MAEANDQAESPEVTIGPTPLQAAMTIDGEPVANSGVAVAETNGGNAQPPKPSGESDAEAEIRLSRQAFNERIGRAKTSAQREAQQQHQAFLQEQFGTTNADEIKAIVAAHKAAADDAEKRRIAEMSALEQAQSELERERAARADWESKYQEATTAMLYEKQNAIVNGIATKHVEPRYLKFARRELAEHLREIGPDAAKAYSEKELDRFFAKTLLKEFPEWAISKPTPPAPKKLPITNGPSPNRDKPSPNGGGNGATGKTARPGQPNSMTAAEVRDHARKLGFSYG
jgi:hypothetical protein